MITSTKLTLSWLWLIMLTLTSAGLSKFIDEPRLFVFIALFIVFIKGQQIIDVFMELKNAPRMWRIIFMCYVFIIPCVIALIYIL